MASPSLGSGYYNVPGSATARTPRTPHGVIGRTGHNPSPSLDGVMSLENVWQVTESLTSPRIHPTNSHLDLRQNDWL